MRLLLVYPEIECSITRTSTYSLPLSLGSIATYCHQRLPNLEIRILDGSMMSHKEQLRAVEAFMPHVTGISSTMASQHKAYEIAGLAKQLDSLVFFGGVNSTNLWQNMLHNRGFIDGVILFDGEIPLYLILNRLKEKPLLGAGCFNGIPNLAFRSKDNSIQAPSHIHIPSLDDLPDIDYSHFDLERFFQQTQSKGFGKALTYYAGKGCAKRGNIQLKDFYSLEEYNKCVSSMNVCSFCGRNELGLRSFKEDREANVVKNLYDKFDVRGFFNVQDAVNLANSSPIGLDDAWFRLFIGTENIVPKNISRLQKRYGSNLIFQAGVESANSGMRTVFGKKSCDSHEIISKTRLLEKEGVQLHASFILGGRGETLESVKQTTALVRRLADFDNVTWLLISPQLVLPGSPDYRALLQMPLMKVKYATQDLIDIPEINRDFLAQFAPALSRETLLQEIAACFDDVRAKNKHVILDVKGVVGKEEGLVKPRRGYEKKRKAEAHTFSHKF